MASLPHRRSGTRILFPESRRTILRIELFQLYASDDQYRAHVEKTLRPLWKAVGARDSDLQTNSFACAQERTDEDRASGVKSPLTRYVDKVTSFVFDDLRLIYKGKPSAWALEFVHADVTAPQRRRGQYNRGREDMYFMDGLPPSQPPSEFFILDGNVRLQVTPIAAVINSTDFRPFHLSPVLLPDLEGDTVWPGTGEWMSFNNWDTLRERAHQALDQEIARLKSEYEQATHERGLRHSRAPLERETHELLPVLVGLLYRREDAPHHINRKKLLQLARSIELSLPRKSRRKNATKNLA